MLSSSLVSQLGFRGAASAPPSASLLKERAARLGITPPEAEDAGGTPAVALPVESAGGGSSWSGGQCVKWVKEELAGPRLIQPPLRQSQWAAGSEDSPPTAVFARFPASSSGGTRPWTAAKVKDEANEKVPLAVKAPLVAKAELPVDASGFPAKVTSELELQRQEELERKRKESERHDLGCKAICQVKHALRLLQRETGSANGEYVVLPNWDADFQEALGDYLAFLRSRPDQFRVLEGEEPGSFTVENVAGNVTVTAAAWGSQHMRERSVLAAPRRSGPPNVVHGAREIVDSVSRHGGEVLRWCGGFGWIRPDKPVDHPAAAKHNGDLFIHATDVTVGWSLEAGMRVTFVVYANESGLGAADCRPATKGGSKGGGRGGGKGREKGAAGKPAIFNAFRRRESDVKPEDDDGASRPLPAQTLRPLAPLRLPSGTGPGAAGSGGAIAVLAEAPKAEEEDEKVKEAEQTAVEEEEDDDDVEAMDFVVDGEEADDGDGDENETAESLGFTIDGEGMDVGDCASTADGDWDIWSLLGEDDEVPTENARPVVIKRPIGFAGSAARAR